MIHLWIIIKTSNNRVPQVISSREAGRMADLQDQDWAFLSHTTIQT